MWKIPVNFLTLHCELLAVCVLLVWPNTDNADAYIIACSLLGFFVIYPYGNVPAIDALFFGASGSTESGLNTYVVWFDNKGPHQ